MSDHGNEPTVPPGDDIIQAYRTILDHAWIMQTLARTGDWANLTSVQTDYAQRMADLVALECWVELDEAQRNEKAQLIHAIRAAENRVRTALEHRLDELSGLMAGVQHTRRAAASYAAVVDH